KNDKVLLCLPVDFIAGKMMVVRAFVLGLNLIPVDPSGNPLKSIYESFDFGALTPMQVFNTLNIEDGLQKLNQIKYLIIGGGDISQPVQERIKELKNNTYHTYGMTETFTHVALKKLNGNKPDSWFKALPGIEFLKDDRECLIISAPHLAKQHIVTNDIVCLKDQKSFQFIGRFDNIINSGGIKISPELIEQKLQPFFEDRFIVVGIIDDRLGQKLVLIIEGKEEPSLDFDEIFKKVSLSKYEIPKQVYFLHRFPETESGKIIRQQVLQMVMKKP
ncbi:MAG: AMP-binding protein, partial [Bacteroidales bacterium]|nr:AMP-binding protein [Bacteroidales bacterium]